MTIINDINTMFSQPPDDQQETLQNNPRRHRVKTSIKKKKKHTRKKKRALHKAQQPRQNFSAIATNHSTTMSAWAESFTHAATWQLKQQIAYWKSKAMALDYENRLLHDIIRDNYVNDSQPRRSVPNGSDTEDMSDSSVECDDPEGAENIEEPVVSEGSEEFVVSEEFIQYMVENAGKKEDARRERERIAALHDSEQALIDEMEAMPTESTNINQETLEELYGENWQRIVALESFVQSQFLTGCSEDKAEYWPILPLNFVR